MSPARTRVGHAGGFLLLMVGLLLIAWVVDYQGTGDGGLVSLELIDAIGRPFQPPPPGLIGSTTGIGLLLIGGWIMGHLFSIIRLPQITGYLVFGIVLGPGLGMVAPGWPLSLISMAELQYLELVEGLAIGLIALIAGAEIKIGFIRKNSRAITQILGIGIPIILGGVFGLLALSRPLVPFLAEAPIEQALFLCLVVGTLAVANSPATVIAMFNETGATGRLPSISLSTTVCKDLILVILFTILVSVGIGLMGDPAQDRSNGELIGEMAWHLLGSMGMGVVVAMVMRLMITRVGDHMVVFLLAAGFGIAIISETMHLAPLLVGLTAGFMMSNMWPDRTSSFFESMEDVLLPVYCVFFAVTGAMISLEALMDLWPLALLIVGVRLLMIWLSTDIACRVASMDRTTRGWLWTTYIPQAGVSLALALQIQHTFRDMPWSGQFASVILASIAITQLIGPPLMRIGLLKTRTTASEKNA